MNGSGDSSKREVVAAIQKESDESPPTFRVKVEDSVWLESSYVRRLFEKSNFQAIKESLFLGGCDFVRLRFLGENFVLLSCEDADNLAKVIEGNKDWLDNIFDSLVPWENSFLVSEKIIWVRVRGLLLVFWSSHCFELIGNLVGSLVKVDEATES
ncbi:hypothetical protein VNO80_24987 [Phaseolus coccineus]|uniref:DUF4283 domain-containing protein n=1 Tax=Phaseolus coccineus TaxID=3886 RepID=A0AAN9LTG1_PHACN